MRVDLTLQRLFLSPCDVSLSPRFCTACDVYVSVFGYESGQYSIVASQGLTRLQEGTPQQGAVSSASPTQYYEFYSPSGRGNSLQVWFRSLPSFDPLSTVGLLRRGWRPPEGCFCKGKV